MTATLAYAFGLLLPLQTADVAPTTQPTAPVTPETTNNASEQKSTTLAPIKQKLLVIDLVDKGAGPDATAAISQAIADQSIKSHVGETVTSAQLKVALDAAAAQALLGCDAEGCMVDVAKTVEAERVLGGSVAKVGDDYLITVILVNARDGTRLDMRQRKVPSNSDLYFYAAKQLSSLLLTGHAADPTVPVQIHANQSDARILIDGKESGMAPTTVRLDPGQHEIRVRKSGYADWRTAITVEDATPLQLDAQLVGERLQLWPVSLTLAGGAVVTGGLGVLSGLAALDAYDGSGGLIPNAKATSYRFIDPTSSEQLSQIEQDIRRLELLTYVLWGASAVLTTSAAITETADIIIGFSNTAE